MERHVRWTTNSVNQLTFFSNVLLTLSVGFLSFVFKFKDLKGIHFSCHVNWSLTFSAFAVLFSALSALSGVYFALNRLYDFLLSRHLALVRYRALKFHNTLLDQNVYNHTSASKGFRRWFLPFKLLNGNPYSIIVNKSDSLEDVERIKSEFKRLRILTYNIGLITGRLLSIQIYSFMLCLISYLLYLFIS